MGLFTNYENYERRLAEYKIELNYFKNCLARYADLASDYESKINKHGNQIKEYDDSLQRYENQIELFVQKYDKIGNDYDSILKESTLNIISKQEDIINKLSISRQKNKGLKMMLGFSLFLNLISISGITFIILYLLEII